MWKSKIWSMMSSSTPVSAALLEDELSVDDEREQVPDVEQEVQILLLVRVRGGSDEQLPERLRLLIEPRDVRNSDVLLIRGRPIGELDLARPAGGPWFQKKTSSVASLRVGISGYSAGLSM